MVARVRLRLRASVVGTCFGMIARVAVRVSAASTCQLFPGLWQNFSLHSLDHIFHRHVFCRQATFKRHHVLTVGIQRCFFVIFQFFFYSSAEETDTLPVDSSAILGEDLGLLSFVLLQQAHTLLLMLVATSGRRCFQLTTTTKAKSFVWETEGMTICGGGWHNKGWVGEIFLTIISFMDQCKKVLIQSVRPCVSIFASLRRRGGSEWIKKKKSCLSLQ